jgi:hypothetical protein
MRREKVGDFWRFAHALVGKMIAANRNFIHKMSIAIVSRIALEHYSLSSEPFARHKVNLLKIESRPIHGRPWENQFFLDVESDRTEQLTEALAEVRQSTTEIRILGLYAAGKT